MPNIFINSDDERIEFDVYPTPQPIADGFTYVLARDFDLRRSSIRTHRILDIGAGTGVWGHALLNQGISFQHLIGVEVQQRFSEDAENVRPYTSWHTADGAFFLHHCEEATFDLIIGNPPYNMADLWWPLAMKALNHGGLLAWILSSEYRHAKTRYADNFASGQLHSIYDPTFRIDWREKGNPYRQDSMYVWKKGLNAPYYRGLWIHQTDIDAARGITQPALF